MRALLFLLLCLALAGCATTRGEPPAWDAVQLARFESPLVRLMSRDHSREIARVSVPRVRALVTAADRISRQAQLTVEAYLIEGAEPNAFAAIGDGRRYIAVTLAMLETIGDDQDAMAALVGHEIAHLSLEHGKAAADRQRMSQGASQVLGIVLAAAGVRMGGTVANVAVTAVERSYSRDDESEADRLGMEYARSAGYDPQGAVRLWEKLSAARTSGLAMLPFLSTHPQDSERLDAMRRLAGGQ